MNKTRGVAEAALTFGHRKDQQRVELRLRILQGNGEILYFPGFWPPSNNRFDTSASNSRILRLLEWIPVHSRPGILSNQRPSCGYFLADGTKTMSTTPLVCATSTCFQSRFHGNTTYSDFSKTLSYVPSLYENAV